MHRLNILFTGCATGMGAYVRAKLLEQGHSVFGVGLDGPDYRLDFDYRPDPDGRMEFESEVADVFRLAERQQGPTDVLVNNAGWTHADWLVQHELRDVERVMRVNFFAAFAFTQHFAEYIATPRGCPPNHDLGHWVVVNTGSGAIEQGLRCAPGYVASKAALHGLTRTIGRETAAADRLSIFTLSPAMIGGTAMIDQVYDDLERTRGLTRQEAVNYNNSVPMRRPCSFEDCWVGFDFLINRATPYWSGTNLRMTGGSGL